MRINDDTGVCNDDGTSSSSGSSDRSNWRADIPLTLQNRETILR